MGKPKPPPPPDYSGIAAASEKSAELSYKMASEQLAWAKEVYKNDSAVTEKVTKSFLESMDFAQKNAEKDRARYESKFQPLEDQLARDAATYDTPERRAQEAGRAQAGVAQQFDQAREAAQRELESYGVNPSATRFAALDIGVRSQEAASQAAAGNQATMAVENTGRALRSEAINVGRGYPAQVAGSLGAQAGMGGGAVQGNAVTTGTAAQTMGTPTQWMGAGNQALNTWGNTLNMGYQNQLSAWNAQQQASSGWGSALGLVGGIGMKLFGLDEGGPITEDMSRTAGSRADDVPAALTVGEFVVDADTVQWLGEKHFHKLTEKAAEERAEAHQAIPSPEAIAAQHRSNAVQQRAIG